MSLPLKELANLNQIISRIQAGDFDANDIDNLLMKLRPYAGKDTTLVEVAHFVAHPDARNKGLAQSSITAFVDSMQYFGEYASGKRQLVLDEPFPEYIYRLFLSQAKLADEGKLKADHKMSRAGLISKIQANFSVDKDAGTCSLRRGKCGVELVGALNYITGFIQSKAAFHICDFHKELKDVMRVQKINFSIVDWDAQMDRISLAVLCLVSNTQVLAANGELAICRLNTENPFRLLSGERRLPNGAMSMEPKTFGPLTIWGKATVISDYSPPLQVVFPVIDTDLDPHEHCDPALFNQYQPPEDFGDCKLEVIDFALDMALSRDFKLVRADSIV